MNYLNKAADDAEKGILRGEGGPFGAVIVRKGKILAVAHNTVLKTNDPTCHAEINAIRLASKKKQSPFFDDCIIYSTTEPCPMCFSAIHWARMGKIIYATTIQDVKRLGFNELTISNTTLKKWGQSSVKIIQTKNKKCTDLLKKWSVLPKKKIY